MDLDLAQVRALQLLARGPRESRGSETPLQCVARQMRVIFPGSEIAWQELPSEEPVAAFEPGEVSSPTCCAPASQAERGHQYVVGSSREGRVLVLTLEPGVAALDASQRDVLRVAEGLLRPWLEPEVAPSWVAECPVGGGVWIDAEGDLVDADDVAQVLLAGAPDLHEVLGALYRECVERGPGSLPERALDLNAGCIRVRAEYLRDDRLCLVAVERLEPGSQAMFRARTQGLSVREVQIAELVLEGWGNRGVAHKLGLKPATINSYLIQVYRKLGVRNRTELAGYLSGASRSGIASKE